MILADKIINERKKNGWSQEELAEKLNVSRQSVSKWEGAQSVPDLAKILKLAEVFGVTTDYLLRDELELEVLMGNESVNEAFADGTVVRRVTMQEADDFYEYNLHKSSRIALGVSMCIASPALLIFLCGLAESGIIGISEEVAAFIGMFTLLALVAGAVAIFIITGSRDEDFKYLEKEYIETEYGVSGKYREKKLAYRNTFTLSIALGVVLCIVSVIPVVCTGVLEAPEHITVAMVSLLLLIVATGVNRIVNAGIVMGCFDMLLEEGDYTPEKKQEEKNTEVFATIYWMLITAGYLAWSFITMKWAITWIIWPIAGVLFGALVPIVNLIRKSTK